MMELESGRLVIPHCFAVKGYTLAFADGEVGISFNCLGLGQTRIDDYDCLPPVG